MHSYFKQPLHYVTFNNLFHCETLCFLCEVGPFVMWWKCYHLLYLVVCWIKVEDIDSLETPCNLSSHCHYVVPSNLQDRVGETCDAHETPFAKMFCTIHIFCASILIEKMTQHFGNDVRSHIQEHVIDKYLHGLWCSFHFGGYLWWTTTLSQNSQVMIWQ